MSEPEEALGRLTETLGLAGVSGRPGALGRPTALGVLGALGLAGFLGLVLATDVLGSLGSGGDFRLRPGGTSKRYRVQAGGATTRDTRAGRRGVSRRAVRINFSFD